MRTRRAATPPSALPKAPTGIDGLDEITNGGLPRGRPTLIIGGAGSGKTLLAMEFLLRGATKYNEPGIFVAFEETLEELTQNVRSLGFDLDKLVAAKKLALDYVYIERSEIEDTGEYDLEGLFVRLAYAIDSIGAQRVVLDTIEALFGGLPNEAVLRAELRRLFRWLKGKGVTAIITGERGDTSLTRYGLEEYVADCVILLDHRISEQVSTRRLRIVKYRGTAHGTNEYPFIIGEDGVSVLPITSMGLKHEAPTARISTGIPRLDAMLEGKGYHRGSSILISGTAGTGKSSIAASFARSVCKSDERCLYLALEESEGQITRNMRSIGIDLDPFITKGLLHVEASRPTLHGLETHLAGIHKLVKHFSPSVVIVDPITNLAAIGSDLEVRGMLTRLIDFFKTRQITAFFTSLTSPENFIEKSEVGISSLMDTWIILKDIESQGERNRGIVVLKSRGMAHSNQIREFHLTNTGIQLEDVYLGPAGVLTGAARAIQEAKDAAAERDLKEALERKEAALTRKRMAAEAQIAVLHAEIAAEEQEMEQMRLMEQERIGLAKKETTKLAHIRKAIGDEGATQ